MKKIIRKIVKWVESFTNGKIQIIYTWKTTKLRSLFPLKDKITHLSHVIYKGVCSCDLVYIGETKRNVSIRWKENNSNKEKSEPSKHLVQNPDHDFDWSILTKAPSDSRKQKMSEAYFITINKPLLNDQKDMKT